MPAPKKLKKSAPRTQDRQISKDYGGLDSRTILRWRRKKVNPKTKRILVKHYVEKRPYPEGDYGHRRRFDFSEHHYKISKQLRRIGLPAVGYMRIEPQHKRLTRFFQKDLTEGDKREALEPVLFGEFENKVLNRGIDDRLPNMYGKMLEDLAVLHKNGFRLNPERNPLEAWMFTYHPETKDIRRHISDFGGIVKTKNPDIAAKEDLEAFSKILSHRFGPNFDELAKENIMLTYQLKKDSIALTNEDVKPKSP